MPASSRCHSRGSATRTRGSSLRVRPSASRRGSLCVTPSDQSAHTSRSVRTCWATSTPRLWIHPRPAVTRAGSSTTNSTTDNPAHSVERPPLRVPLPASTTTSSPRRSAAHRQASRRSPAHRASYATRAQAEALARDWDLWNPGVPLVRIPSAHRALGRPIACYVRELAARTPGARITVLIPEAEPARLWQRLLQDQRGAVVAHALRRDTDAVICRLRFRLSAPDS